MGGPDVKKHGTGGSREGLPRYLYSPEGQEIAAKNYYRPRLEAVAQKYAAVFPKVNLFTVDEVFGGWQKAQKTHFDEGGVFDQIQQSQPMTSASASVPPIQDEPAPPRRGVQHFELLSG